MSKRRSKNAINFAGKNWGLGRIKKAKNQKKKKSLAEKQFTELCQKFGFNTTKNQLIYAELEAEFKTEFTSYKTIKRKEILNKVTDYKKHCKKNNIRLNIFEYLTNKLYDREFYAEPKNNPKKLKKSINAKEKTHKTIPISKSSKNNLRPIRKGENLSDFLTNEIIIKLKNLNNK